MDAKILRDLYKIAADREDMSKGIKKNKGNRSKKKKKGFLF